MGSRRKRRKLATVHMDRLDFKGVSDLTSDDEKPELGWMAKVDCINDVVSVQTRRKERAIDRAKKSVHRNNGSGTWIAGKVKYCLPKTSTNPHSTVFFAQPREGLHLKAARFFAKQEAQNFIYVACNPKSLGIDWVLLEDGYLKMTDLWIADMFSHTQHVECVGKFSYIPSKHSSDVVE